MSTRRFIAIGLVLGGASCGEESQDGGLTENTGGLGGSGESGGSAGAAINVGKGGSNGTGGSAAGATGGSEGGGSAGAAGADSGGSMGSACEYRTAELSGTWNEEPWQRSYAINAAYSYYDSNGPGWQHIALIDSDGFIALRGEGESPRFDDMEHDVLAILLTPSSGPEASTWFCGNSAATYLSSQDNVDIDLGALGRLGACAEGVPVDGTIVFCDGVAGNNECMLERSGTLDGASYAALAFTPNPVGEGGSDMATGYPDSMLIRFKLASSWAEAGTVSDAFVITPDRSVYCAGEGSTSSNSGTTLMVTLTDFRKIGSCVGVTGTNTARGCLGTLAHP
jgi:hypothetical protein